VNLSWIAASLREGLEKEDDMVQRMICLAAVLLLVFSPAMAGTRTWRGQYSTDWNTAANWWEGAVPAMGDDVVMGNPTSFPVSYLGSSTSGLDSLTITNCFLLTNGHTLLVNDGSFTGTTTITGGILYVNSGSPSRDFDTDYLAVDGGTLNLLGGLAQVDYDAQVDSGQVTGHGTLEFGGTLTNDSLVSSSGGYLYITRSGSGSFDMDGGGGSGEVVVSDQSRMYVQVPISDPVNGTVTIGEEGVLEMDYPWTLAGGGNPGTLDLQGPASMLDPWANLQGAAVTLAGNVTCTGYGHINAPATFSGNTTTLTDGYLSLDKDTEMIGATFTADGTGADALIQRGDLTVTGGTTSINVDNYDWDGYETSPGFSDTTVQAGATLSIHCNYIVRPGYTVNEHHGNITVGNGAELEVRTAAAWVVEGSLQMQGGLVYGSELVNNATVSGFGHIQTDDLDNNGVVSASGGTLRIYTIVRTPDLDGSDETGALEAIDGDLEIVAQLSGPFAHNGSVTIGSSRTLWMLYDGLGIYNGMAINGGTYEAPDLVVAPGGTLTTSGTATIDSFTRFRESSTTSVSATLVLKGQSQVWSAATFTGGGEILNDSAAVFQAEGSVGVDFVNAGRVEPGMSGDGIDTLTLPNFEQTASGVLAVELAADGGTPGVDFDQLVVDVEADLAGELEVGAVGGFVPESGDSFEILTADSVTGSFDTLTVDITLPDGLTMVDVQDANSVTLVAAYGGDLDLDGAVSFLEAATAVAHIGLSPAGWADGDSDRDGDVDIDDADWAVSSYLGVAPPEAPASSSFTRVEGVPEPGAMSLLAIGGLGALLRRRR
jgi:hypothetical protein